MASRKNGLYGRRYTHKTSEEAKRLLAGVEQTRQERSTKQAAATAMRKAAAAARRAELASHRAEVNEFRNNIEDLRAYYKGQGFEPEALKEVSDRLEDARQLSYTGHVRKRYGYLSRSKQRELQENKIIEAWKQSREARELEEARGIAEKVNQLREFDRYSKVYSILINEYGYDYNDARFWIKEYQKDEEDFAKSEDRLNAEDLELIASEVEDYKDARVEDTRKKLEKARTIFKKKGW